MSKGLPGPIKTNRKCVILFFCSPAQLSPALGGGTAAVPVTFYEPSLVKQNFRRHESMG